MLTILIGRAGSGKSTELLCRMKKNGALRRQIMLVPEQASYEAERRLCEVNGNDASMYGEVFSFTSFEHRISALYGGLAVPALDDGGRILMMYAAVNGVREHLSVLSSPAQKPEFLESLIATMDELKSCCVTPEALSEVASQAEGLTGKKFQDMALIFGSYDALTAHGHMDPRDRLTRLTETLRQVAFSQNKDFYVDGFTDFTPQEERVLEALIQKGNSVTVSLTCDSLEQEGAGLFGAARHTARLLIRMAQRLHKPFQITERKGSREGFSAEMNHLEQFLFEEPVRPFEERVRTIEVIQAKNTREEVLWAAGKIRTLLQEGAVRCRDIAVSARSMEPYQDLIESIFDRYEIPVFQSNLEEILQKSVFSLVTAALDMVNGNFAYDDVFRYLKTGLSNISLEDCDLLENYALLWNIRGSKWTSREGFVLHPRGYQANMEEGDKNLLEKLNEIRCKVIDPFNHLSKKIEKIEDKVIALYRFLEEVQLPEKLEARAGELLRRGEPELAMEYRQLWEIFTHGLEQCVALLGDMPIDLDEFSRLLKLLLSQYQVGAIPTSLDRVITGDLPRLSNRGVKALFILGADDGSIPQIGPDSGLFSERDRELLSDYGIALGSSIEEKLDREMTILYTACAQPTEHLYVTWPGMGDGGSEKQPSFLVERLEVLFPNRVQEQKITDVIDNNPITLQLRAFASQTLRKRLLDIPEYAAFVTRLEEAAAWKRGALSAQTVHRLYGKKIAVSPSRLDRYKSCHFAYYLQYGLKAKARKKSAFSAPEYGTFVHYVLEFVLRAAKNEGGVAYSSNEEIKTLTEQAVRQYSHEILGGLGVQTPRFRYLFARLKRTIVLVVENVIEELRKSEFQPIFFELGFGKGQDLPPVEINVDGMELSISGFVDRVDGYVKDGRLYIKVVDYKTGRKSFDLTEIWNGLGLQMLLYLFALENHSEALGNLEVVPAGVLYLPAQDAVASGSRFMEEEARRKQIDKELTRKGLILDEPEVLAAMEDISETGPRFLPIRVSAKTGKISGDALVSAEKLGKLKKHLQTILEDICVELEEGIITADPYWRGPSQNACLYCDYKSACHFEEQGEDQRRWIPSMRNSEFWSDLEAREKGE